MTTDVPAEVQATSDDSSAPTIERLMALEARLAGLEAEQVRAGRESGTRSRRDRRDFLKAAGIAAAGVVATSALKPDRAAAADGGSFIMGTTNASSAQTSLVSASTSTNGNTVLEVDGTAQTTSVDGVHGHASNGASTYGVLGTASAGYGVVGISSTGVDLAALGTGRVYVGGHGSSVPAAGGTYLLGEVARTNAGDMFVCVAGGASSTWRKIAGPGTAGQLHLITPVRAYASDAPGESLLTGGNTPRTVSLASAIPTGARAALFTVTVFSTINAGFLTIYNADLAVPGVNTILWNTSNQYQATTSISAVNTSRQVKVNVYAGSACNFQIDVLGYFL